MSSYTPEEVAAAVKRLRKWSNSDYFLVDVPNSWDGQNIRIVLDALAEAHCRSSESIDTCRHCRYLRARLSECDARIARLEQEVAMLKAGGGKPA